MRRPLVLWIIAIVITLGSVVYQHATGPTYPIRGSVEVNGEKIKFRLLTTNVTDEDARMEIKVADLNISGEMKFKRYKSHDDWSVESLAREGENLIVTVPKQRPAGKVMYQVSLIDAGGRRYELTDEPVVIRYKGAVPKFIIFPHIIIIFMGMLLATRAGLEALAKGAKTYSLTIWTTILLVVGGLIFGPLLQKFAFGEYWTGWPVGHDLTDSKTAFAVLFWLIALWRSRGEGKGRFWIILAAIVTLIVYLIPHSVLGSEIDYTKGLPQISQLY
ncbi:MAG: hypothetical protein CVT49_04425 [candidate division Zixibacteria bacterium HGW-Zixibacteria-1]|nr:MAG: hypothetical protein CVT49_04425 [candidate division Zixibacteria bacterium HGW-Zixibacteria-1]